jgi:NAD(P)-dependent dehydrogenase (short-subunit alcohol dehydrogenase family)
MSTKVLILGAGGYIGEGIAIAFRRAGFKTYGVIRNEKKKLDLIKNEIIPIIA